MSLLGNFNKRFNVNRPGAKLALAPFLTILILISLLIILVSVYSTYKNRKDLLKQAFQGYNHLSAAYTAASGQNFSQADEYFSQANTDFQSLENNLNQLNQTLTPVPAGLISSALHLSRAGQAIASTGNFFILGTNNLINLSSGLSNITHLDSSKNTNVVPSTSSTVNLGETISNSYDQLLWAKQSLDTAASEMSKVDTKSLPDNLRPQITDVQEKITKVQTAAKLLLDYNKLLRDLFQGDKNYLLVFQNTAEARPTGGFVGTYGQLSIKNGSVQTLLIEGIYAIDNKLTQKINPPEPLQKITDRWGLRDANWWPDFYVSSVNMQKFYKLETNQDIDGIIAVTPDLFTDILKTLGPIPMPAYDQTITADNFYDTVQFQTSKEGYYTTAANRQENKPKKFISDLSAEILKRLSGQPNEAKLAIAGDLFKAVLQKNLLLFSTNRSTENEITELGLSGQLLETSALVNSDQLLVTNTNLGGGKTDRNTIQEVSLKTLIDSNGNVNKLIIRRTNNTAASEDLNTNKDYLRVYVPQGSTLISSSVDPQIFEELGRTVFASYFETLPGQTTELTFEYRLPKSVDKNKTHAFIWEKNPGQKTTKLDYEVDLGTGQRFESLIGPNNEANQENIFKHVFSEPLTDQFIGFIIKP